MEQNKTGVFLCKMCGRQKELTCCDECAYKAMIKAVQQCFETPEGISLKAEIFKIREDIRDLRIELIENKIIKFKPREKIIEGVF